MSSLKFMRVGGNPRWDAPDDPPPIGGEMLDKVRQIGLTSPKDVTMVIVQKRVLIDAKDTRYDEYDLTRIQDNIVVLVIIKGDRAPRITLAGIDNGYSAPGRIVWCIKQYGMDTPTEELKASDYINVVINDEDHTVTFERPSTQPEGTYLWTEQQLASDF